MELSCGSLDVTKVEVPVARSVELKDKYKTIAPALTRKRGWGAPLLLLYWHVSWPWKASRRLAKLLIRWKSEEV